MRIESASLGQDEAPAIAPRVEKATSAWFHKINRVVVEVKDPGASSGFRKLNAISLDSWPVGSRTSVQEDELNIAIMQVAIDHVEETGESNRFRARYMGGADASGRSLRKYACFKVSTDSADASSPGPFAAMPSVPAGLEPWIPVLRWLMSMLEAREQQLMAYNETMTNKLLESAAQAEPLLKAHGAMSGILEQAVWVLRETMLSKGGLDGTPMIAGQGGGDGDDDGDGALQQVVAAALMQFFTNGRMPVPPMPGMSPDEPEGPPQREPQPTPAAPPPRSAPTSGVRFGFDESARGPETAEAGGGATLVKTIRALFGGMDGLQLLALTDAIGPAHSESLRAVRAATTNEEATQAVLAMQRTGGWATLREQLVEPERSALARIEALVRRFASSSEAARPVEVAQPSEPESEHLLVFSVRRCLGAMDGDRVMELTGQLCAEERALLQAVRVAETDDAAAEAVMELGARLSAAGKVPGLLGVLHEHERDLFRFLYAQADAHLGEVDGTPANEAQPAEPSSQPPRSSGPRDKVEAVLCLPPRAADGGAKGPLHQAAQAWLQGVDGDVGIELLSMLTPEQRKELQRVRAARSDAEVADAVLDFKAALLRSMNWMGLMSRLGQRHLRPLLQIQTMAQQHVDARRE